MLAALTKKRDEPPMKPTGLQRLKGSRRRKVVLLFDFFPNVGESD
jgi:hypothetical protein